MGSGEVARARACPACGREALPGATSCAFCHVVFAKYRSRSAEREAQENAHGELKGATALVVEQQRSLTEALVGFERRNQYVVRDEGGRMLYFVEEESHWLVRQFLGAFRPLTLALTQGNLTVLSISKPFRLWHDCVTLTDGGGRVVGTVQCGFPIPVRWYTVRDARGVTRFRISGAFWRPWTFKVFRGDAQVGEIRKKWSGLVREYFTDADNFAITLPADAPADQKALLLAALFLIDIVHFENNNSS